MSPFALSQYCLFSSPSNLSLLRSFQWEAFTVSSREVPYMCDPFRSHSKESRKIHKFYPFVSWTHAWRWKGCVIVQRLNIVPEYFFGFKDVYQTLSVSLIHTEFYRVPCFVDDKVSVILPRIFRMFITNTYSWTSPCVHNDHPSILLRRWDFLLYKPGVFLICFMVY